MHPFCTHTYTLISARCVCVCAPVCGGTGAQEPRNRLADTFVSVSCRCRSSLCAYFLAPPPRLLLGCSVATLLLFCSRPRAVWQILGWPRLRNRPGPRRYAWRRGQVCRDKDSIRSPAAPIWALHTPDYNPPKESEREGLRGSSLIAIVLQNSTCNIREFINTDRD